MLDRLRFWLPAVSAMTCLGLGAGLMGIYGFFVEPLSREFGVGAAVLNTGPVALLLVPGIIAPFVGRLADRLPIRRVVLAGVTLAMLALMAVSRAPTLALAAMGFVLFAVGLTGYGPVVINGLMVKMYPGQEARALALAAIGISIATAILPPVVGLLLEWTNWRNALFSLSAGLMIMLWIAALASFPDRVVGQTTETVDADKGFYRRREFWLVGWCVALAFNCAVVLAIAYPPHFTQLGYSAAEAGGLLAVAGGFGLLGKAAIAWAGDAARAYVKWLAIGLLMLQSAGLAMLLYQDSAPGLLAALAMLGFGGGAFLPMHPYLNSRYFDAGIISRVNGAQMPLFLPFGLIGAPLAGYVFDQTGTYEQVIAALAVVLVIAATLVWRLPRTAD